MSTGVMGESTAAAIDCKVASAKARADEGGTKPGVLMGVQMGKAGLGGTGLSMARVRGGDAGKAGSERAGVGAGCTGAEADSERAGSVSG